MFARRLLIATSLLGGLPLSRADKAQTSPKALHQSLSSQTQAIASPKTSPEVPHQALLPTQFKFQIKSAPGKHPSDELGIVVGDTGIVEKVIPSSIAWANGVRPLWVLLSVGGHTVAAMKKDEIHRLLNDRKNATVEFESQPQYAEGGNQWRLLKRYLYQAWVNAAFATKHDIESHDHRMENPVRITQKGFVFSLKSSLKFAPDGELMKALVKGIGEEKAEKAVDDFFKEVFSLGLQLMFARGADRLTYRQGIFNPRRGLDKHAFAYSWLVAHGFQYVNCWTQYWCSIIPEDGFLEPHPLSHPTDVDFEGPLARARSKYFAEKAAASFSRGGLHHVIGAALAGWGSKWPYETKSLTARQWFSHVKESDFKRVYENRWFEFQYAKHVQQLDLGLAGPEVLHERLRCAWNAAKQHGWHGGGDGLRSVGFQYMSLLLDEFVVKGTGRLREKVEQPDNLLLVTDDDNWPQLHDFSILYPDTFGAI